MSLWRITMVITALVAGTALASPPPAWLHYDDGTPYQPVYRVNAGDGWAVKYAPTAKGYIQKLQIYVGNPSNDKNWYGFDMEIWDWNSSAGMPGQRKWGPVAFTYSSGGWVTYNSVNYYWNAVAPFVFLIKNRFYYPQCDSIFCDTAQTSPNPNYSYFNGQWYYFTLVNGDFLMRTLYGQSYPDVEPSSLGRVKALYN